MKTVVTGGLLLFALFIAVCIASPVAVTIDGREYTMDAPEGGTRLFVHGAVYRVFPDGSYRLEKMTRTGEAVRRRRARRVLSVTTNDGWRVFHFDDLTSRSNRVAEVRHSKPAKIKYGYPQGAK